MKVAGKEAYCYVCDEIKMKTGFHKSLNTHHKHGVVPVCKECCNNLYSEYFEKTGRPDSAMWCICADLGIPFLYEIWEEIVVDYEAKKGQAGRVPNPVKTYIDRIVERNIPWEGFWQSDRMLDSFMDIGYDATIKTDQEIKAHTERQIRDWGNYEQEDLDFLDNMFENYTSGMRGMNTVTIMRYRDLCKAELQKRKADDKGDIKEIADARKNVFEIMKLLKIDSFKGNEKSDEEKRIEKIIWQIENTKPAECEDLERYRDFSGIDKTWKHVMRCVQNLISGSRDYPQVPKSER